MGTIEEKISADEERYLKEADEICSNPALSSIASEDAGNTGMKLSFDEYVRRTREKAPGVMELIKGYAKAKTA